MPAKRRRTRGRSASGQRFLSGQRGSRSKRGKPPLPVDLEGNIILEDGEVLNHWESMTHRALTQMGIAFEAQKGIGAGAHALGGGKLDFFLPAYNIDLDPRGAFHFMDRGQAQDFWRDVEREMAGIHRIFLDAQDFDGGIGRLMTRIRELLGTPMVSSVVTRR